MSVKIHFCSNNIKKYIGDSSRYASWVVMLMVFVFLHVFTLFQ